MTPVLFRSTFTTYLSWLTCTGNLCVVTMASGPKSTPQADALGPVLSPTATYAERQAYRRDVLNLPGPVDRWLTACTRSPHIAFLKDYLMIENVQRDYVTCLVEAVCVEVRKHVIASNCKHLLIYLEYQKQHRLWTA